MERPVSGRIEPAVRREPSFATPDLFARGEAAAEIAGEAAAETAGEAAADIMPDTIDGAPPDPGARREPSLSALAQRLAAAGPRTRMRLQDRQGPAPVSEAAPGGVPEAGPRTPKWWLPPEEDQAALADYAPHPPLTAAGYAPEQESVHEGEEAGTRWPPEGWPTLLRRVGLLSAAAVCGFGVVALGQSNQFGAWLKHMAEPAREPTAVAAAPATETAANSATPATSPVAPVAPSHQSAQRTHVAAASAPHAPAAHTSQPTTIAARPRPAPITRVAVRREASAPPQAASFHAAHPEAPFPARLTAHAAVAPTRPSPPPHRTVHYELPSWLNEPPPPLLKRPPLLSPPPRNLDAQASEPSGYGTAPAGEGRPLLMSPPPHNLDQPYTGPSAPSQQPYVPPPPYMQGTP